ncbi:MAG TPA: putative toxin-antitoxin system toxin component, PIN family [Longimicrobiaceae bacterium]|nr:putative toxin-antitoxin system toxin component, PIN family [Longimicrobiaceae bacterium]
MRLVLDTNVLISAFISRGLCSELLEHCARHHELVTSAPIVDELRDKLLTKFRLPPPAVDHALAALFVGMEMVEPGPLPGRVARDADDDVVIATALAGACEVVVPGDSDLLVLVEHRGIRFLSPRTFWEMDRPATA